MDNHDKPIGRLRTRREALALLALAGAGALAACTPGATTPTTAGATATVDVPTQTVAGVTAVTPACVVRPEVTEGPYYVDEGLIRADIRADTATGAVKAGTPLKLRFLVSQITADNGCAALPDATVEVWHCDADGVYSDVTDTGFDTTGQDFLRGALVTDANGVATFTTIYPGWYSSRTVHIHFKVRPNANQVLTSQIFFDDALSDVVFEAEPYAGKGQRDTLNSNDSIYEDTLLVAATATADGRYEAIFAIGVDLT
ncbi:MAG: intradiol ring-cleavage dioxygenase [Anaerolineales bacterium]|nr:intradiol ring-cleavage dioxygenase [Anaerolineales bacterium]